MSKFEWSNIICVSQFVKILSGVNSIVYAHCGQRVRISQLTCLFFPQLSTGTVNWQAWLRDSGNKMRQIRKNVADIMSETGFHIVPNEWLKYALVRLQWNWAQQQQQTHDDSALTEKLQKILPIKSEEIQEILQEERKAFSLCEDSANTQVPCAS